MNEQRQAARAMQFVVPPPAGGGCALTVDDRLISAAKKIKERDDPVERIVSHCGCGEVSISQVFTDSQILYFEDNRELIRLLRKEGYTAHGMHAFELQTLPADLLVLGQVNLDLAQITKPVKLGGYVLCDDWHRAESILTNTRTFEHIEGNESYSIFKRLE